MAEKIKTEIMLVHETALQSWTRDASTFVLIVAIMSIGIAAGSSAMQWLGAIMAFITMMIRASGKVPRLSISEARKRLDEIERGAA